MSKDFHSYVARRYDTREVVRINVADETIQSVESLTKACGDIPFVGPGFFDIQVNGANGVEFSSSKLSEEGVTSVLKKMLRDGVFRICPTLTTNAPQVMIQAARTIKNAIDHNPEYASIAWGIHLEGPFISLAEGAIGAHPKKYCVSYSRELFDNIQRVCDGLVKIVTLYPLPFLSDTGKSPEYSDADGFIRYLRSQGVLVAIGHTNATGKQLNEAVCAGASLSTHLSNATRHLLPKWENYFFGQLADDRLFASIIVDGFHISPQLVRAIVRTKGLDRLILISDQSPLAGFPPGKYSMELCDFEIQPNGKVTLAGDPNLLACASFPISTGVANLASIENLDISEVYPLATTRPARLLGAPSYSSGNGDFLELGKRADFLIFRVQFAAYGEMGILDGNSFKTGRMIFEKIVWRGREII